MQPWRALVLLFVLLVDSSRSAEGVRGGQECDPPCSGERSEKALQSAFIDATHVETSTNGSFESTEVLPAGRRKHGALRVKRLLANIENTPNWTQAQPAAFSEPVTGVPSSPGFPWMVMPWQHGASTPSENISSSVAYNDMRNDSRFWPSSNAKYQSILGSPDLPEVIVAIVGGTGASIGSTGSIRSDRDLLRRMHYQDKAVIVLVIFVYVVALAFSASFAYRQAANNSPVTYYADPRFHSFMMEGNDISSFLEAFNQPPQNIHLQVSGLMPVPDEDDRNPLSVEWLGEFYNPLFIFSLDLSPWVVRKTNLSEGSHLNMSRDRDRMLDDGLLPEDRQSLLFYLANDQNDLSNVEMRKEVSWPEWEELAANIKHQIRQRGFTGVITVHRTDVEAMLVYKNRPWANFMHAKTTKIICALSMIGWLVYAPYMWCRRSKVTLRSHFRVDLSISEYWPLIADKLSGDVGFRAEGRQSVPVQLA